MAQDENATPKKGRKGRNNLLATLGGLGLVLLLVIVIVGLRAYVNSQTEQEAGVSAETPATAESQPVVNEEVEGKAFVIKQPIRDGNRLNSEGVTTPEDPEALRRQIAEQAKCDPLTLFVYYMASPLGDKRPLENEAVIAEDGVIEDGNIFSERGVEAYEDWLFLWQIADIEAVKEITFQAYNTGVDGTKVTKSNGVGGSNKAGYDVAYRDVSGEVTHEHSVLERCTQPTFGVPIPWAPEGPTDCPTCPIKGLNPYDSERVHQESVSDPGPIPGYRKDNAERVVEEQKKSTPGNREPTKYGTDSGSTTNPTNSRTTSPDGTYEDATPGTEVETNPPSHETVPPDSESGFDPYDVP